MDYDLIQGLYGFIFAIFMSIALVNSVLMLFFFDKKFYRPHSGHWTNPKENATGYDPFGVMMRVNLYFLVYYIPRVRKNYLGLYKQMINNLSTFDRILLRIQLVCMIVFWLAMIPMILGKYFYLPDNIKLFIPLSK